MEISETKIKKNKLQYNKNILVLNIKNKNIPLNSKPDFKWHQHFIISITRHPQGSHALTIPYWTGPLCCLDPPQRMSLDPPELSFLNPDPGHPLEYGPSSGYLRGEI